MNEAPAYRILVADDRAEESDDLVQLLEENYWEVVRAYTGWDAFVFLAKSLLDKEGQHKLHAAILDNQNWGNSLPSMEDLRYTGATLAGFAKMIDPNMAVVLRSDNATAYAEPLGNLDILLHNKQIPYRQGCDGPVIEYLCKHSELLMVGQTPQEGYLHVPKS